MRIVGRCGSGRPLSGDIAGGNGGDMERRRTVGEGRAGSGDGTGVVDEDVTALARSGARC